MNKRILAVIKKSFKENYIGFYPKGTMPGMPKNYFLRIVVLLLSYVITIAIGFAISTGLAFFLLNKKNLVEEYFMYTGIIVSLTLIIHSIFKVISDFYSSKDSKILLTMPLKESDIFIGKFFGSLLSEFDYLIFFILIMLGYFFNKDFNILKILIGLIGFVCILIVSFSLVCLFIMIIMRFTNARKYKNVFKFIGYGLGLFIFGLYYYFIFSSKNFNFGDKDVEKVMAYLIELHNTLKNVFYPVTLYAKSIAENNFISLAILILITLLSLLVIKAVSSKIYFDSIIEKNTSSKKKKSKESKNIPLKRSSQTTVIFKKELYSLIKNPIHLYQSGLVLVITVAILLSVGENINMVEIQNKLNILNKSDFNLIFLVFGMAFSQFIFSTSVSAFSSLSREGKSFYLTQTLPIDPESNLLGRFVANYVINFISTLIIVIVSTLLIKINLIQALLLFIGMVVTGVYPVFFSLYWGSKKINISWVKPQELQRTGVYGLLMGVVSIVINAAIYGVSFLAYWLSNSLLPAALMLLLGSIIASVLFYLLTLERYKKGFFDVK